MNCSLKSLEYWLQKRVPPDLFSSLFLKFLIKKISWNYQKPPVKWNSKVRNAMAAAGAAAPPPNILEFSVIKCPLAVRGAQHLFSTCPPNIFLPDTPLTTRHIYAKLRTFKSDWLTLLKADKSVKCKRISQMWPKHALVNARKVEYENWTAYLVLTNNDKSPCDACNLCNFT